MAVQKRCAGIILTLALCLTLGGCGVPLLSERQIVQAIFFSESAGQVEAVLLLSNGEGTEGTSGTLAGFGQTPAEALHEAEQAAKGPVFYGLMDLAVLPAAACYAEMGTYADAIEASVLPASRMDLVLWQRPGLTSVQEQAPSLYADITTALAKYGVRNGLYQISSRQNICALPVWQGTQFDFVWLQAGEEPVRLSSPLQAQLAAVLDGQANRLDCLLDKGSLACTARTVLRWESKGDTVIAELTLCDLVLADLAAAARPEAETRTLLENSLQTAFREIRSAADALQDPLRLQFWSFQQTGFSEIGPAAQLIVRFAD